jgi:hypothetical protein
MEYLARIGVDISLKHVKPFPKFSFMSLEIGISESKGI